MDQTMGGSFTADAEAAIFKGAVPQSYVDPRPELPTGARGPKGGAAAHGVASPQAPKGMSNAVR